MTGLIAQSRVDAFESFYNDMSVTDNILMAALLGFLVTLMK